MKRPVQLLYPLKISQPECIVNTSGGTPSTQPQPHETPATCESVTEPLMTCEPVRHPVRAAGKKAAEKSLGPGATKPELIVRLSYNVHIVEQ